MIPGLTSADSGPTTALGDGSGGELARVSGPAPAGALSENRPLTVAIGYLRRLDLAIVGLAHHPGDSHADHAP